MRLSQSLLWLLAFITTIHALALPVSFASITDSTKDLFKRKGGGGGHGSGGSGGGRSGGSGSGSSSSSSSGSGSGSGSRGSGSTGSGGGRTTTSAPPSYGGARGGSPYYAGGSASPYGAGNPTKGGIRPGYIAAGAGVGFFGGALLFGAYTYPYHYPYTYHNNTNNQNQTLPVECFCEQYTQCGCEDNNSTDYINSVANDNSVSHVAMVNGTKTLVVNGTIPNVTEDVTGSGAGSLHMNLAQMSGWWVVVGGVGYTMWFM